MEWLKKLGLTTALVMMLAVVGCSSDGDDDPTDPGGGGPGDTTAPQVVFTLPEDGTLMVENAGSLMVQFDESMDPIDATAEITMSHGSLVSADWMDPTTLFLDYSDWPQGTWVTVALGTGFKDVAGNPLKAEAVMGFGTWSDDLFVFGTTPVSGATDINRNASVVLDFGAYMESSSVSSGITISDGLKADLPFVASSNDEAKWLLDPVEILPANTEITVTIGTGVVSVEGTSFAEPYVFTFTTNDQIDNEPPTIVSIDPPNGSTMSADQENITFTFSEPVDPNNFKPKSMSGQLQWLLGQSNTEPWFNPAGDVLTVPLPTDLPAGLPMEAVFTGYSDLLGNVQMEETNWSCTVAGTAEAYPLYDGQRYLMVGEWADGAAGSESPTSSGEEWVYYQITKRAAANQWNKEEWLDPDYIEMEYYEIQVVTTSSVSLAGFAEYDGSWEEFMLNSPATWAKLPAVAGQTWLETRSVNTPDGLINVSLAGETVGMEDLVIGELDGIEVTWQDVWHVRLVLDIGTGGSVFSQETNEFWYAPGVGVIRDRYREEKLEPGNEGWHTYDRWLSLGFE